MPIPTCIEDSEDDFDNYEDIASPAPEQNPQTQSSTADMSATVNPDIFDVSSTFVDHHDMRQYGRSKRRRTESISKSHGALKENATHNRRSHTSSSTATQRAREDVLMPDLNDAMGSGGTVKFGSSERDSMLQGLQLQHGQGSDHSTRASHSSSSVPWSADQITAQPTAQVSSRERTTSSQVVASSREQLPESTGQDENPYLQSSSGQASSTSVPVNGLPAEQYKPRPSRSRSAQVAEPQIDWSVAPEKAAKSKKRRAESAMAATPLEKRQRAGNPLSNGDSMQEELMLRAKQAREEDSSGARTVTKHSVEHNVSAVSSTECDDSHIEVHEQVQAVQQGTATTTTHDLSQENVSVPAITDPTMNVSIEIANPPPSSSFATPGLPASASLPSPSRSSKARRSHTTIFEDHVGLDEQPDASPNLKQQQAQRKRGRPRKTARKDEDIAEGNLENQGGTGDIEKPVTKKRGRPAKTPAREPSPGPPANAADEDDDHTQAATKPNDVVQQEPSTLDSGADKAATESTPPAMDQLTPEEETTSKSSRHPDVGGGQENQIINPVTSGVEKDMACSARTTHSPIKKGGTIFRVGLSKRQRIQPLLRMLKR